MQAQLDRTRAETNAIRDAKDKAERIMEGLGSLKIKEDIDSLLKKPEKPPAWITSNNLWAATEEDL